MTAKEFYQNCVPDAKYFFNIYFAFVVTTYVLRDNPGFLEITDVKNNRKLDDQERSLFFFLMALFVLPTSIGNTMKHYGADIFKDYKMDDSLLDILIEIAGKSRQFTEEQQENYFQTNLKCNPIMAVGLYDGKITVEEVLLRLMNNLLGFYDGLKDAFKIAEIQNKVEELAKTKGRGDNIVINVEPDSNLNLSEELKRDLLENDQRRTNKGLLADRELTKKKMDSDPLIGRQKESRIFGAYLLDRKKSVILYGKPGVGKTTIVEGLAYRIQNGTVNPLLRDKRIFEMSATEMINGTPLRGQFEGKMLQIIKELMDIPNAILFIDEIHMIMGGGRTIDNSMDISNILKPYVGNGKIKIIGATTEEEYKAIKRDGALMRRFNGLYIPELSSLDVMAVLNHEIASFQEKDGINFTFSDEKKDQLFQLLIGLADSKYQGETLAYNPDLALTILNNGYNLARYDGDDTLSLDTLVEGVEIADQINQEGKNYFKDEVLKLVRNK